MLMKKEEARLQADSEFETMQSNRSMQFVQVCRDLEFPSLHQVQASPRSVSSKGSVTRRIPKISATHDAPYGTRSQEGGPEAAAGGPSVHRSPSTSARGSEQVEDVSHITAGLLPLSAVLKQADAKQAEAKKASNAACEGDKCMQPQQSTSSKQKEGSIPMQSEHTTVDSFLQECGLGAYASVLKSNGFDRFAALLEIRQEHLEALGLPLGHQLLLLRHLRERAEKQSEDAFDASQMAKLRSIRKAALEQRFAEGSHVRP